MPRTALITGASGLLGREVLRVFQEHGWNVIGIGLTRAKPPTVIKLDLSDLAALQSTLDKVRPQVVIHCAANRFPDRCDADPEGARRLNVDASRQLAQATASRSIFLVYISTDYVFPGKPGEAPYEADAPTQPPNLYGQTKLDGEKLVLQETKTAGLGIVIRVPVLYGKAEEPKESAVNVLMDALWKAQEIKTEDAKIEMDDWAQRYPTNTEDVGRVTLDVAQKYLEAGDARQNLPRILQFSSEDKMTKYEICEVFADIMGLPLGDGMVRNKTGGGPEASVQRPYDTHLSTRALKEIGINVNTQDFGAWWRREVKAFRK